MANVHLEFYNSEPKRFERISNGFSNQILQPLREGILEKCKIVLKDSWEYYFSISIIQISQNGFIPLEAYPVVLPIRQLTPEREKLIQILVPEISLSDYMNRNEAVARKTVEGLRKFFFEHYKRVSAEIWEEFEEALDWDKIRELEIDWG